MHVQVKPRRKYPRRSGRKEGAEAPAESFVHGESICLLLFTVLSLPRLGRSIVSSKTTIRTSYTIFQPCPAPERESHMLLCTIKDRSRQR
jgi:hypothetical protein